MANEELARHENLLERLEGFIEDRLDGPIKRLIDRFERTLERAEKRLETLVMTMQNLEELITQINTAVETVTTEVNDLITRLQGAANGLTAEEAAQLATDLQASLTKIQAIAPEPA